MSNKTRTSKYRLSDHPQATKTKWYGVPTELYWVEIEGMLAAEVADYLDFVKLVYAQNVRISLSRTHDRYWLEFIRPIESEAGLRVGRWLYGVDFSRAIN